MNGRYRVLSLLGQGSFSHVYLTNDEKWRGNLVALKEIPTAHYSDKEYADFNAHFLREAAFLMKLQHEGLPRVIEFFASGQNYYLALEWIPGNTLESEVQKRTVVPETDVVRYGLQLAEVLRYLHSQKPYPVLLGDLKPANVVVDFAGSLRVVDFGVARYAVPGERREFAMVSPGFSPPEQYTAGQLDARCDLYALGATLYWCLHPTALEKYRFELPLLRSLRPDVSRELELCLNVCLQPDRRDRFHHAGQVIEALRGVQRTLEAATGQTSPSEILSALYRNQKKKFDF